MVEEHLRREEAFRKKVFNRETGEVMRLIEEYEKMQFDHLHRGTEELRYSELVPDLKYIQS